MVKKININRESLSDEEKEQRDEEWKKQLEKDSPAWYKYIKQNVEFAKKMKDGHTAEMPVPRPGLPTIELHAFENPLIEPVMDLAENSAEQAEQLRKVVANTKPQGLFKWCAVVGTTIAALTLAYIMYLRYVDKGSIW